MFFHLQFWIFPRHKMEKTFFFLLKINKFHLCTLRMLNYSQLAIRNQFCFVVALNKKKSALLTILFHIALPCIKLLNNRGGRQT